MKDFNFRRKITTKFNAFGTRFLEGDVVELNDKEILHYYVNLNKDGVDLLKHDRNNLIDELIETFLDNSQDI